MAESRPFRVLLHVTGCIAAYKAAEVLRLLQKAGCEVRVGMTEGGERFVGKATFEGLTRYPVLDDLFAFPPTAIPHIDSAEWADLQLVCPCTANVLAKIAHGMADDAVTSCVLAATSPVLIAPAMNVHMWRNAATQENVELARKHGIEVMAPSAGRLACGDVGEGKLPPVEEIAEAALQVLKRTDELAGRRILITAGPTHEAIDPVRYIANASSGKMGYALAAEAARRGAAVTLVSGPVSLSTPYGVERISVTSAEEMHEAALAAWQTCGIAICAAAVSDYTPASPSGHKLKKGQEQLDTIQLVETKDILADLGATKGAKVVCGFAAETGDAERYGRDKLERKHASMIVANDISRTDSTFGSDTDKVSLILPDETVELPVLPKTEVAAKILDKIQELLEER
ncbi:MAG: bifunctional phosphopantothenoylcysteine decarboxylase/phosphopantothenate--cysteine ligase CoaBC [Atopobiaceae bacterium]